MAISVFERGRKVRLSAAFTDVAGSAADPTTVTVRIRKPNGTNLTWIFGTDAEVVKDSTGNYHADVDTDIEGDWYWRWEGTGAVVGAIDGQFKTRDGVFG